MSLRKRLLCDVLNLHRGTVVTHEGWTFLKCSRCGRLRHPISPQATVEMAREDGYDDFADEFEERFG